MKSAFDVAGAFIGFVVLAALLGAGQVHVAVAALAVVLITGFIVSRLLLPSRPTASAEKESKPMPSMDLRAHRPLVQLVVSRFLFLLGIYVVGRFLLVFAAERLGLGADAAAEQAGSALALLALITVLAWPPSGWLADRLGRRPLMRVGGLPGACPAAPTAARRGRPRRRAPPGLRSRRPASASRSVWPRRGPWRAASSPGAWAPAPRPVASASGPSRSRAGAAPVAARRPSL